MLLAGVPGFLSLLLLDLLAGFGGLFEFLFGFRGFVGELVDGFVAFFSTQNNSLRSALLLLPTRTGPS